MLFPAGYGNGFRSSCLHQNFVYSRNHPFQVSAYSFLSDEISSQIFRADFSRFLQRGYFCLPKRWGFEEASMSFFCFFSCLSFVFSASFFITFLRDFTLKRKHWIILIWQSFSFVNHFILYSPEHLILFRFLFTLQFWTLFLKWAQKVAANLIKVKLSASG